METRAKERDERAAARRRPGGARRRAIAGALWTAATLLVSAAGAWAGPAVGEPAPAFSLKGTDGRSYTLEGLLADHEGVVLAWFPKAFTPG